MNIKEFQRQLDEFEWFHAKHEPHDLLYLQLERENIAHIWLYELQNATQKYGLVLEFQFKQPFAMMKATREIIWYHPFKTKTRQEQKYGIEKRARYVKLYQNSTKIYTTIILNILNNITIIWLNGLSHCPQF